mgnify:CR=1 FL=1
MSTLILLGPLQRQDRVQLGAAPLDEVPGTQAGGRCPGPGTAGSAPDTVYRIGIIVRHTFPHVDPSGVYPPVALRSAQPLRRSLEVYVIIATLHISSMYRPWYRTEHNCCLLMHPPSMFRLCAGPGPQGAAAATSTGCLPAQPGAAGSQPAFGADRGGGQGCKGGLCWPADADGELSFKTLRSLSAVAMPCSKWLSWLNF